MLRCQILRFIFQSTLPREERQWMMRHGKRFTTFQSTLPREERLFEVKNLGKVLLFQSTLPREERHRGNRRRSDCYNFNPRSHERSDEVEAKRKAKLEISIHAPTRGATYVLDIYIYDMCIFQSTLPREERQQYCTKNLFIFIQYRQ